ncbi:MAG TPA: helix-turn-helix transcriptional regulator, partial [Thermomicrobiales bacterium]|nr:helix-turn-helix transcriptional regulator [Thermomicrobiales bacterium]
MDAVPAAGFGQLLRRHRLEAGLSQDDLAERAGLSTRGVSDLERGRRTSPRAETVRMLADALNLSAMDRASLIA